MRIFQLFFLNSIAIPVLALVPRTREPEPRSLVIDTGSTLIPRHPEALQGALEKRSVIQYDGYLPQLPAGWPNITAVEVKRSNSESRDLAIRPRGDVITRDDPNSFQKYLYMGLKIYAVVGGGVAWYGLIQSCAQIKEETGNGVQCVFGAISQVIAVATLAYQGSIWRGQLAERLTNNGWQVPGINKRDEWANIMARSLSAGLKTEVRHLGTWDGIETNQKRDSEPALPREVFGVKSGGQDFHFTYMGRDAQGKDSFKLGLGVGGFQPNSKERRQNQITDGNFYFSTGGIDFAIQSVESPLSTEWNWGSAADSVEFSDIYNSVNCYLGGFGSPVLNLNNAISFQVYDTYQETTLSAGIMSPFSATRESAIRSLSITGGIPTNSCKNF